MTELAGVRATSMAASAGLFGALVVLAFTATLTHVVLSPPRAPAPVVPMFQEAPPPPPLDAEPVEPVRDIAASTPDALAAPFAALAAPSNSVSALAPFVANSGPVEIGAPHWISRPRDLGAYYPRRARQRGAEGLVVLDCLVSVQGALDCRVASETPANWGFGEAALRIARDHRMEPARQNGEAVEGRYRMVTPFRLD